MARRTVAHERAKEVLADGQWHDYDKVIWEVRKAVPPHLAIRRAEAIRVRNYIRNHPGVDKPEDVPPRARRVSQDTLIRTGTKSYARDALSAPGFEHALNKKGVKVVRLRPPDPQPLPEGWSRWKAEPKGPLAGMTQEQIREWRRVRAREAMVSYMAKRGVEVGPDYESQAQRKERFRREYEAMSEEERHKYHSEKSRKAARTRLIKMGIDPDQHETQAQRKARLKAERAALPPEERYRAHSELSKKGWATRKAREQKENDG